MAYPAATDFDTVIPSNLTVDGNLVITGSQTYSGATAFNGGVAFEGTKVTIADVTGATTHLAPVTVGVNDTGHDVRFYGATSGKYWEWDESLDTMVVVGNQSNTGTITVGVDDTGYDVKFFGATTGKYMEWDESADQLDVTGSLDVTGAATVSTTLGVTGATTLTGGIVGGTPYNCGTWTVNTATSGTDTACSNGTAYVGTVRIPANCTVTGIQYLVGSVGGTDSVVASLHSAAGAVLANSALAGATVGTAAQVQQVAFTSPYAAVGPQTVFVALTFNGNTAKFRSVPAYCNAGNGVIGNGVTQTFGTAASFTPPTTFTADKVPVASLY